MEGKVDTSNHTFISTRTRTKGEGEGEGEGNEANQHSLQTIAVFRNPWLTNNINFI